MHLTTMKTRLATLRTVLLLSATLTLGSCSTLNYGYLAQSGIQALQAATITDAQIQSYVAQYIAQLDAKSNVLPAKDPYSVRLAKITSGLNSVNGVPLNFKVYKTKEVNAFACADGSVRVYTGLMDIMTDEQILGVIGHEIGHVALKHSKKQLQSAMLANAAMIGVAATSQTAATLTQSGLGAVGEALFNASHSRKQETEADDYAYSFLKENGKSPVYLMNGLQKLQSLEASSTRAGSPVNQLFSSHPEISNRVARVQTRLISEGSLK